MADTDPTAAEPEVPAEASEADALEQQQDVHEVGRPDADPLLEANEADLVEQQTPVSQDEEDYR